MVWLNCNTFVFLNEDLTKAQVVELKQACRVVANARRDGKWAVIKNLKVDIRDWEERQAPKAK